MEQEEYLTKTEHAVRHYYNGLSSCWNYYEEAIPYWSLSRVGLPLTEIENRRIVNYLSSAEKYFSLKFSEAVFAGSILQVAATGIRIFSKLKDVPPDCLDFVHPQAKGAIPFCIGERIFGIPTGLLIYAARNQYVHWEEDSHEVTKKVFNLLTLSFHDDISFDLAFDLKNPNNEIYANEILLGAIKWVNYGKYLRGMRKLLETK